MSDLRALSPDGQHVRWTTLDGDHVDDLQLDWDNEAWTATGHVSRENVQYVLRLSPTWHVRQFLLFRDLDEPDLWLAIDTQHRWGEMNGSYRPELDGCVDIELNCTPFSATAPIRRLELAVGGSADIDVITIDVETLAVVTVPTRYERVAERAWRSTALPTGATREFEVDQFGLVVAEHGRFKRIDP